MTAWQRAQLRRAYYALLGKCFQACAQAPARLRRRTEVGEFNRSVREAVAIVFRRKYVVRP